jgi:hypothetical protein
MSTPKSTWHLLSLAGCLRGSFVGAVKGLNEQWKNLLCDIMDDGVTKRHLVEQATSVVLPTRRARA